MKNTFSDELNLISVSEDGIFGDYPEDVDQEERIQFSSEYYHSYFPVIFDTYTISRNIDISTILFTRYI